VLRATRLGMLAEGPTPAEARTLERHFAHLSRLTDEGVLVLAGRTLAADETTMGIAVFRAASDTDADAIMASDPAVADGVMTAALHPFRIALLGR
jgi:uncharacterized protein